MEKGGVSIGMFQTSYLSFDVRRTECVGQNHAIPKYQLWSKYYGFLNFQSFLLSRKDT